MAAWKNFIVINYGERHMYGPIFFEIPVYRLSEEKYNKNMDEHIKKHPLFQKDRDDFYERNPHQETHDMEYVKNKFGGIWRYNEIIGYIQLYISGNQILGKYFENDTERQIKTRRKRFKYISPKLAPEIDLPLEGNNKAIYEEIYKYIKNCKKELPPIRFIDMSVFEKIGPYVEWRKFIEDTYKVNFCDL